MKPDACGKYLRDRDRLKEAASERVGGVDGASCDWRDVQGDKDLISSIINEARLLHRRGPRRALKSTR